MASATLRRYSPSQVRLSAEVYHRVAFRQKFRCDVAGIGTR